MRKLAIAVLGALSLTLLMALPAVAQSAIGPPEEEEVLPQVIVRGGLPGGVAFTGSQVTVWMVLAAVLLLAGVTLLLAARRRAKAARN